MFNTNLDNKNTCYAYNNECVFNPYNLFINTIKMLINIYSNLISNLYWFN